MGRCLTACAVVAMAGAVGACGAPSGQGAADSGTPEASSESPSVSAIVPSRVFLARTTQVTLSGYATHWSSATQVDFGAGITVENLVVASPTALSARVTTTKGTPVGVRDVVVNDGDAHERYAGAFQVAPPVTASFQGTMAQGALALMTLQVQDTSTPLDLTSVRNLDGTTSYPNLSLSVPAGVGNVGIASVSDFELSCVLSVDVDAAAAAGDLDLVSGPAGATTDFPLPTGIRVTARSATPMTPGVDSKGQITSAYDSALYALTPEVMAILDFHVTSTVDALDPAVALLPSSGHFADLLGFGNTQTTVALAGMPLYAVYWENTGGIGPYAVNVTSTGVAATAAASPVDQSPRHAVDAAGLPFVLTGGDLAGSTGDYVRLRVTRPTRLRVQTIGDLATDTLVTAYQSDARTRIGTSIDTGFAADGTISLLGAGTYYVLFSQGTDYAPPHTKYTGIIRYD